VNALAFFGEHAPRLAALGYDVIPISPPGPHPSNGKRPAMVEGWQRGCPREDWPRYARCGVGILSRRTPALDVDVLHPDVAHAVQAAADRELGDVPYRIGRAPKLLLPYRLAGQPFAKLKLVWRSGLGADMHPPTKPPGVEILADGQQFVALGIHPDTGQPYRWHRDPDLSLPRGLLTPRSHSDFVRFLWRLAAVLRRLGAEEMKLSGPGLEPQAVSGAATPRPRVLKADAERIREALERMGNPDLHYDDWIRLGHAIKAELPGDDGRRLWEWWSSLSSKNDPRATGRKWAGFNPRAVTAGTIFWESRQ